MSSALLEAILGIGLPFSVLRKLLMSSVTKRRFLRLLALAEEDGLCLCGLILDGTDVWVERGVAERVSAIAEGLVLWLAAGTPPVGLPRLHWHSNGLPLRDSDFLPSCGRVEERRGRGDGSSFHGGEDRKKAVGINSPREVKHTKKYHRNRSHYTEKFRWIAVIVTRRVEAKKHRNNNGWEQRPKRSAYRKKATSTETNKSWHFIFFVFLDFGNVRIWSCCRAKKKSRTD